MSRFVRARSSGGLLRTSRAPLALAALLSGSAYAAGPSVVFRAEAMNIEGDGVVEVSFEQGEFDPGSGTYHYSQSDPVDVVSEANGQVVATITGVELWLETGTMNAIDLSFGVLAGSATTTFVIESPIIRHRTVPASESQGRASSWITITDLNNNFAMLQGLGTPGTGAYTSYYNIDDAGEGTRFTNLIGFLYAGQGATVSGGQMDPPTGFRNIPGIVHSSHAQIAFTITPGDEVSVTSLMEVPGRVRQCTADVDADWDVDLADLAALLRSFGSDESDQEYSLDADLDLDGIVDLTDLTLLLSVFGSTCQ